MSQKKIGPRWRLEGDARMTPSLAREMISALAASGLSVSAFSRLHDIPKQRVCYWRRRLLEIDGAQESPVAEKRSPQPKFAPVIAKSSRQSEALSAMKAPAQTLEATLPGGNRVVVHGQWDVMSMRSWLEAIEGGRC